MVYPEVIGTPHTSCATKVMLLGSGYLSRELAMAFQRLGVEVHAVDRVRNAPAQQVAHVAHAVDVTDARAVTDLIASVRPDFIVPEVERIAANVLTAVEATERAAVVPNAKAAELALNREGIRKLAAEELGLPTTNYQFVSEYTEFEVAVGSLGYPCVAKPDHGGPGAKDHRMIRGEQEVEPAWRYLTSDFPAGAPPEGRRIVVERVIDFDYEVTLVAVRSIDPATGKLATWFCEPIGCTYHSGEYTEAWQPVHMEPAALDNARSVAARVSNALGGRGVFSVKMFVSGEDVYFSEVLPRPHCTGLVTLCSQRFSQFDLHARAVLGLPIDVTLVSPGAAAMILSPEEMDSPRYAGLDRACAVPEATVEFFGKQRARAGQIVGVALATGENTEAARAAVHRAAGEITVSGQR
ncbi:formate-dependent phosphoribosylglycinamide formyltransferase [Corynebacterium sp. zg-331]|uniref:formate-dependent phosphoribosylglycinamide formyltransferase n=1 Tax=unclassified Corynebacterium TaxID=2624378 RepID=UPI00128E5FE9|nr:MULTISPECIES: formate-dependent phosphoribosylglycinamide formyltransferase [unclassified Corynebacterium]MBC3185765.1 formate-dependent phosphoribosylglycinamide formyltransferase [Corynebacterium sp. zg-331]MPV52258.1 formate-dependent phosphoribosylglycinamide formyltransferase [Corynebacterium sp. zg331]